MGAGSASGSEPALGSDWLRAQFRPRRDPTVALGLHFALEPEGRFDAVYGNAVEDLLDLALVGACRLGAVIEDEPQPGHCRVRRSITVLLRVYANSIDGQADAANSRIDDVLDDPGPR